MLEKLYALIAEDSVDDTLLLLGDLKKGGFDVEWLRVQSAEELTDALKQGRPWQIVLSDYSMPGFTAIDVIHLSKKFRDDLPCIIISGAIGEDTAVKAMQAGAKDFFVKGRLSRLPAAIRRELAEAQNLHNRKRVEEDLRMAEKRLWQAQEDALEKETQARQKIEKLYEESQQANRLKEEFLTTLSHELRTPMNAITGWATMLANGECDSEDYPMAFSTIYRNAKVQNKLIDDLLDLSRIMTGKLVIEHQHVALAEVARAAIQATKLSALAKSIDVEFVDDLSAGPVLGDAQRLQEVIWNLLSNSIKFTPRGGKVRVSLHRLGSMLELSVSDNGEGISEEFLPYVFDRFRQADGSLTRKHGGLGLGLTIVRQLVELHGGQVEIRSPGLGKGTTALVRLPLVTIRLPIMNESHGNQTFAAIPEVEKSNPLLGVRILVLDDQVDSLKLMEFLLKRHGALVTCTESPHEALVLLHGKKFDLFICDIEMPHLNGYEVIQEVRASQQKLGLAHCKSIALTAHAGSDDVERAKAAGFDMHIAKPVEVSTLLSKIQNLLEGDALSHGKSPELPSNA